MHSSQGKPARKFNKVRYEQTTIQRRQRLAPQQVRHDKEGNEKSNDLHELFLDELADIYNAEQQLTKALPKLAKTAKNDQLREGSSSTLRKPKIHISRPRPGF